MKINHFRGELTDISAKKEALLNIQSMAVTDNRRGCEKREAPAL